MHFSEKVILMSLLQYHIQEQKFLHHMKKAEACLLFSQKIQSRGPEQFLSGQWLTKILRPYTPSRTQNFDLQGRLFLLFCPSLQDVETLLNRHRNAHCLGMLVNSSEALALRVNFLSWYDIQELRTVSKKSIDLRFGHLLNQFTRTNQIVNQLSSFPLISQVSWGQKNFLQVLSQIKKIEASESGE